jgi:hypothetical protein
MPISHLGLFIAIVLINHIALLRIAAADELNQKTLTCAPLCSGLLTGITLIVSTTLLECARIYAVIFPVLHVLNHFLSLLIIAFVAHLLCVVCFKLKPISIIAGLFPIIYINSVGLNVLVPTMHIGLAPTITALIVAVVFIIASSIFYYGNLHFNKAAASKTLSLTLLMAGMFALLFFGLIAFH